MRGAGRNRVGCRSQVNLPLLSCPGYLKFGDLPADECVTEHKKSTKKNTGSSVDAFRLQSVRRSNPLADADAGARAGAGAGAGAGGFAAF